MAQKVTVALIDDLDGGPAEATIRFGLEGAEYEIDLSGKNARAFRKQLAPFIEHARKAPRELGRRAGRTAATRQRSGDIRAWAKDQGIAVSDRGRIPARVLEQYAAAAKRRLLPACRDQMTWQRPRPVVAPSALYTGDHLRISTWRLCNCRQYAACHR
jgi:hypothetical protein